MPQKRFHKITWEGEGWLLNTILKGDNLLKIRSLGLTCSPLFSFITACTRGLFDSEDMWIIKLYQLRSFIDIISDSCAACEI